MFGLLLELFRLLCSGYPLRSRIDVRDSGAGRLGAAAPAIPFPLTAEAWLGRGGGESESGVGGVDGDGEERGKGTPGMLSRKDGFGLG